MDGLAAVSWILSDYCAYQDLIVGDKSYMNWLKTGTNVTPSVLWFCDAADFVCGNFVDILLWLTV